MKTAMVKAPSVPYPLIWEKPVAAAAAAKPVPWSSIDELQAAAGWWLACLCSNIASKLRMFMSQVARTAAAAPVACGVLEARCTTMLKLAVLQRPAKSANAWQGTINRPCNPAWLKTNP